MNVTKGTVRFSSAEQNEIGGKGMESTASLEFTGKGETIFSGPLRATGVQSFLNITRGTAVRFSSAESSEVGGKGMRCKGNLSFTGAGRTNFTGPLVSSAGKIACGNRSKLSFRAEGSRIGGEGLESAGELDFESGTTAVTADFISTGKASIAAEGELVLDGRVQPAESESRRLRTAASERKPRAQYKDTSNAGRHDHTDVDVTHGKYAQAGSLKLNGSTSFRCSRGDFEGSRIETNRCDHPFNQTAGETQIGAGSELENDDVHVKGGSVRGNGGKVRGHLKMYNGSRIKCGTAAPKRTGKLHVAGNVTMDAGSTFEVKIMGAEGDGIVVTEGTAHLGGHLAVQRSAAATTTTARRLTEVSSTIVDGAYEGTFDSTDCVAPDCTVTYSASGVTVSSTVVTAAPTAAPTTAPSTAPTEEEITAQVDSSTGTLKAKTGCIALLTVYLASALQ
jgi:hypothetical protein